MKIAAIILIGLLALVTFAILMAASIADDHAEILKDFEEEK